MNTRKFSDKQEKIVAKKLGGKQVVNSGATTFQKGDVSAGDFIIECKTKTKPSNTFTVYRNWLVDNEEIVFAMGKKYSAVALDFGDGEQYYIINQKLFNILFNHLKEEE